MAVVSCGAALITKGKSEGLLGRAGCGISVLQYVNGLLDMAETGCAARWCKERKN